MFNKIAYNDIGAVVATCPAEEGVEAGKLVKMVNNCTVAPCQPGDKFCGVALAPRNGLTGVQFKGFANVIYSMDIELGWNTVVADKYGGITPNENGIPVLVVSIHGNGTVDICL